MSAPTPQQQAAIAARGNVLVAAGAGTGKTSTITERCVRLVLDEKCPLDQILMVTFTEAAAAEMRERIRKALHAEAERWGETPGEPGIAHQNPATAREDARPTDISEHLAEQIALLETAPISTLHSFCLELVRRNFHALGLDPQFTVLDEQQTKPLLHAVLDALFERHYAGPTANSGAIRDLVRHYGNGSDDGIRQLVVKIHQHAQALAAPEQWLAAQTAALNDPAPSAWRQHFVAGVVEWAQLWREAVAPYANGCTNVKRCAQALDGILAEKAFTAIDAALAAIIVAHEMKWDALKKDFRDPIKAVFTDAEFLYELTREDGAALAQDWEWTRHHLLALLQLAREFTADFTQAKRELGGIDFADQEQLALRLLYDDAGNPTPVALACRERFRFVFVDECQDINAAQDAILRAVSREGANANRFLVGDVKQSIYRFRLADPRIFQNYEARWSAGLRHGATATSERRLQAAETSLLTPLPPKGGVPILPRPQLQGSEPAGPEAGAPAAGRVLALSENFRSREALLNFINPLFRALMRPVIGGLHYDAEAELKFGDAKNRTALAAAAARRVELHVITKDSDGEPADETADATAPDRDLADLQATEREARLIARRLRTLKDSAIRSGTKTKKIFAQ